jgi:hypothetical protein
MRGTMQATNHIFAINSSKLAKTNSESEQHRQQFICTGSLFRSGKVLNRK